MSNSRIFIGLSRSRHWSHSESHGPNHPMPAAILENSHREQPCYGFLGLLKFLCSQTSPNLVNCFLIIFSLVWHAKDFAQIKITNGKKCIEPKQSKRNREKLQPSFNIPPLDTPRQASVSYVEVIMMCRSNGSLLGTTTLLPHIHDKACITVYAIKCHTHTLTKT